MSWKSIMLAKAGSQTGIVSDTNVRPDICIKPALDQNGQEAANLFALCVQDDQVLLLLTTIAANQQDIITRLTNIENLLAGGIDVNVISGGL